MMKSTKKHTNQPHPETVNEAPDEGQLVLLRNRIEELESQFADAQDARQRALADFLNYQKRAIVNERESREEGAGRVLESLLSVADYLDMALKQDTQTVSAKAVMDGVWLIREELHKVFREHGVQPIAPAPGDELDSARHDAMGHESVEGVRPGCIAQTLQPGYQLSGRTLRAAKVLIAPETPEAPASSEASAEDSAEKPATTNDSPE